MLVALTGATGFVGGHVLRELLARGHQVRVLLRSEARLDEEFRQQVTVVAGGLDDLEAVSALARRADVVLHLAGAIKAVNRQQFMSVNAQGAENVARAAADESVDRFVLVSTLAAREPRISGYAASKAAGEQNVQATLAGQSRDPAVIIRPPAVYGPGDEATFPLIRELTRKVTTMTGTSRQRLSVIYVEDLARALADAVEGAGEPGAVYELDDGTPDGYSHADLARAVKATTGHQPAMVHIPRGVLWLAALGAELWMSVSREPAILSRGKVSELYHDDWVAAGPRFEDAGGWKPAYDFEAGYARTLSWYRDNGWLPAA